MKKTASLLFILALPLSLTAQVDIVGESVKRVKGSVEVAFDIRTTKTLKKRYKMVLTPYLYNGADTAWLPRTEIYGKIRYKRERQEQELAGNRTWRLGSKQIMDGESSSYAASVPYEKWLRTASLGMKRRIVGCTCDCSDGDSTLLADIPIYVPPVPEVRTVEADPRLFKIVDVHRRWEFREREMKVDFRVSRTELDANLYGNRRTLDEIVEVVRGLQARRDRHLSEIEIYGFASPEGHIDFNERLAEGRAEALREYIRQAVPELSDEQFRLVNGVENWDGLRRMVAGSQMPGREEVLAVIDSIPVEQGRKSRLMALRGGDAYRYMLREFFPLLRNACYVSVYYDVLEDTAATKINEAHGLIREGRYAEALRLLEGIGDDPRAYNAVGVCHMMLEEEDEAAGWFEKAVAAGYEEARENLEQIR